MCNPVVIDNYDSFTYNLVYLLREILGTDVAVFRNDEIEPEQLQKYTHILLSPGPGIPKEAGYLKQIIQRYSHQKSILGVCLGHQAIAEVFGGTLKQMPRVVHGKQSTIRIQVREGILARLPDSFCAGRYHSWLVRASDLPGCLRVTAVDEEGQIMALRHAQYSVFGVQFHPESVLTPDGRKIIENWLTFH